MDLAQSQSVASSDQLHYVITQTHVCQPFRVNWISAYIGHKMSPDLHQSHFKVTFVYFVSMILWTLHVNIHSAQWKKFKFVELYSSLCQGI